jgi:hypothetical protein
MCFLIQSQTDVESRTGYSLAVGCMYHYCGGMSNPRQLQTAISILTALAGDTMPQVQVRHTIESISGKPGCSLSF